MTVYRFKSRETNDVVMMEREARHILELLGKELKAGIIQPGEMAKAATVLREAAKAEEKQQMGLTTQNPSDAEPADEDEEEMPIGLAKRIAPFLEMLRRCEAAQVEVVWGV